MNESQGKKLQMKDIIERDSANFYKVIHYLFRPFSAHRMSSLRTAKLETSFCFRINISSPRPKDSYWMLTMVMYKLSRPCCNDHQRQEVWDFDVWSKLNEWSVFDPLELHDQIRVVQIHPEVQIYQNLE